MRMLHAQRAAMARMGRGRRALHRFLWAVYQPLADVPVVRRLWGRYRRTWP